MAEILKYVEFLLISFVGAACFLIVMKCVGVRRRGLINQIGVVALSIFLAGGASGIVSVVLKIQIPNNLGPERTVDEWINWRLVSAFTSMLIGMAAGYFNKAIDARRVKIAKMIEAGNDGRKPGIDFDVWEFFQPLLVSIVTFGAIMAKVEGGDLTNGILLGFETGFFWQSVIAKAPNNISS